MFATPANLSACPDPILSRSAAPASPRDRVLLVEDQDCVAGLLTAIVERDGLRALHASSGREALRLLHAEAAQIALVLLDCTLPDFNGGQLCQEFRRQLPGLPVLFVSGRDLTNVRVALAADGPTGFLRKPFFPAEVLREVRALIGATV